MNKDYNSPEEVIARANQEDPTIMYLIVREDLGMSIGKTAAQCAHASQMLTLKYFTILQSRCSLTKMYSTTDLKTNILVENVQLKEKMSLFDAWLDSSFRKVVLKADDKEWEKIKEHFVSDDRVLVIDAGLTELEPGSETVIGLWPMKRSNVPKIIKRLQVLK